MPAGPDRTIKPFCSERCRGIDLGRWLGERYRVKVRSMPDDLVSVTDDNSATGEGDDSH
jgi:endogenous inhibitor of DNA gyrase (YacG/DUF329 family)